MSHETQVDFNLLFCQFVTRMNNMTVPSDISAAMEEIEEKKKQLNILRKTHTDKIFAAEKEHIAKIIKTTKLPKKIYCVGRKGKSDDQNMTLYANSMSATLSGAKKYQNQLRTELEHRCTLAQNETEVSLGCTLVDPHTTDKKLEMLFVANALPLAFRVQQ